MSLHVCQDFHEHKNKRPTSKELWKDIWKNTLFKISFGVAWKIKLLWLTFHLCSDNSAWGLPDQSEITGIHQFLKRDFSYLRCSAVKNSNKDQFNLLNLSLSLCLHLPSLSLFSFSFFVSYVPLDRTNLLDRSAVLFLQAVCSKKITEECFFQICFSPSSNQYCHI